MVSRWEYAIQGHPAYCTCARCNELSAGTNLHRIEARFRKTLERWRAKDFDPHLVLGLNKGATRKQIDQRHGRLLKRYLDAQRKGASTTAEVIARTNDARDRLLTDARSVTQKQDANLRTKSASAKKDVARNQRLRANKKSKRRKKRKAKK